MPFLPELGPHYPERAAAVGLRHEDVEENFILGSGHGGQNRNKRSTAVQLVHHASGIEIRCFHKRGQHQNRIDAWEHLLTILEERQKKLKNYLAHEEFVERVQKRGRSKKGKRNMLEEKRMQREKKERRRKV